MPEAAAPTRGTVIWLEDEPGLLLAEIYDLRALNFSIVPFTLLSEAYDWALQNAAELAHATAILVDVTMPHREDRRFDKGDATPGGVVFCERLKELKDWKSFKSKIMLYTRIPLGGTYFAVERFARDEQITLVRKSSGSRIASDLVSAGIITL